MNTSEQNTSRGIGVFKLFRIFVLPLVILLLVIYFTVNTFEPILKNKIHDYLEKSLNTQITVKDLDINIFTQTILLDNLVIENSPQFRRGTLLEAEQISIKFEILPLFKKQIVVSNITMTNPRLNLYELENGETNWDFLWPKKDAEAASTARALPLQLPKEFLIKNGTFEYTIEINSAKKANAELHGLFIYFKNYPKAINYAEKTPLFSKIKGRGYIPTEPNGTVTFSGEMNLVEEQKSFSGNISMENISLTYFNNFYPPDSEVKALSGTFSAVSKAQCIHNQLTAKPNVTVKNLRLKITDNYSSGNIFQLPVSMVVGFFDINEKELKFSFEVTGSLSNPEFHLEDVLKQHVVSILGDTIVKTITASPEMLTKLGQGAGTALMQLGKPFEGFIKGLRGE